MDLDRQRQRLEEMLRQLELCSKGQKDLNLRSTTHELTVLDNHPADVATENYLAALEDGLGKNADNLADKVRSALERLKRGDYGICRVCGGAIDSQRLEVLPYSDTCRRCSQAEVPVLADPNRPQAMDWPRFRQYGTSEQRE